MMRTRIMAAALFALTAATVWSNADIPPDALARSVTDEVLAVIRADRELQAGNPQKVMQLVEIQRGGVDGLIRTLNDKNKSLAAQAAARR